MPHQYEAARDGSFVIALQPRPFEPPVRQLFVITNWAEKLRRSPQ
jgi:hypothetical protein